MRAIRRHPALQYLIEHEPGEVLAHVSFDELDPLLAVATAFGTPYLARYLDPATAAATAEWVTRLIVSYGIEALPRPRRPGAWPALWSRPSSCPASPPISLAAPPPDPSTPL